MPVFLNGLYLQNFRGIGPDVQKLSPFREFNFFVGANNAGKSTVLDFLHRFLTPKNGEKRSVPAGLDRFTGSRGGPPAAGIGIPVDQFIRACPAHAAESASTLNKLCRVIADDGIIWLTLSFGANAVAYSKQISERDVLSGGIQPHELQTLWSALTQSGRGSINEHWIPQTLQQLLSSQNIAFPPVQMIPAIRQIGPAAETFSDLSGRGLIDKLAAIQSPDHDSRDERKHFDSINLFLQTVTGRPSAQIEIPHNRAHVLVHMDNKVLPLSSLGTGIHEVIMIAAFCTLYQNQIVCIEEPELHLHPLLQRKLITYLLDKTINQYFVATHSASFIDTPGAAIFHVANEGTQTTIKESILRSSRFSICKDLGTKASDILQSNAVVWVEGPSDRIYLRHWIKAAAPDLVEGTHYSIMFYGGRLLSHLTANDDDVSEFIGLRSLNQHLAIIIDSDRDKETDAINETKRRIETEFSKKPGIAWITAGREIENYVDHIKLQVAAKAVHHQVYDKPKNGKAFDHSLYFVRTDGKVEQRADKVKIAKLVCEDPANLDTLDLKTKIDQLVDMIRLANE